MILTSLHSALNKRRRFGFLRRVENIARVLSPSEKLLFRVFALALTISSIALAWEANSLSLIKVPMRGGKITEGVVGFPRFVNPLLAASEADRDLAALVYSGLTRPAPDGSLVPDMAESYEISPDGLTYTFRLKKGLTFHDGHAVSAEDVVFTMERALDSAIKSPRRSAWEGVEATQQGPLEIIFRLPKAYAPFLENTTQGILPKHIWKDAMAEQFAFSSRNIEPIGSGPYKIKNIKRDETGVPITAVLAAFDNYALGQPFVEEIRFRFYPNEGDLVSAYMKGDVEGLNSISPEKALELQKGGAEIVQTPLPRIFAVFFNHNQLALLADKPVREALSLALDRQKIIDQVLHGYGTATDGPIPAGLMASARANIQPTKTSTNAWEKDGARARARALLEQAGWERNPSSGILEKKSQNERAVVLSFALSTSDVPELKAAAGEIKKQWAELGADVRLEIFEAGDLNRNVIRPRKFDSLLFGEVVGREMDLYAFWHSSQRTDPGLNIALYANITSDKLLEEVRAETNKSLRAEKYIQFEQEIFKDSPAVFIYTPDFIYIPPKKLKNINLGRIVTPSERFMNVHEWYLEEDGIWPIFIKQ